MATVIQEGKMSAPSQGGLFQNQIYWLSHRVPQRSHIINQIRSNGGSVVLSDRDAEICLVDHLRDEGEGMFSYEYITKSLKMEKLQDLELYRVQPKRRKGTGSTTLAPSSSISRGRNFFTQEEDDILLEALSKPGLKLSGNAVYQKLAKEYPKHTMHSWRGRWVDHHSKLMPNGPIPPGKKPVENKNESWGEEGEEQIRIKREGEEFTEQDEAVLDKWAELIAIKPHEISIYERLSELYPQHTPKQWRAHFVNVVLPRRRNLQKPVASSRVLVAEPGDRHIDSNNEQQPASSSKDRAPSGSKQEVKTKTEPIASHPSLNSKKRLSTPGKNPPIHTVNLRNHPNNASSSTNKGRNQPSTSHQRRKATSSSPSYRPTTPTVPGKASIPATPLLTMKTQKPAYQIPRWRAEVHRAPIAKGTDVDSVPPSSPPQPPPDPPPTTQKRKRDSDAALERKKSRNVYRNTGEVASAPEPELEGPSQSRVLSPELLGSDHHPANSPPIPKDNKLSYAEMSTQAIYDQLDDDPSLEFPEIEIPSASPLLPPPPAPSLSPRFPTQRNPSTPTKLLAPTPGSTAKFTPLSPTKDDPDGIKDMNTFLDYCQKKYKISEKKFIYAVERASGIKKLVELVLQSVADDKPLPTHVPGVWSEDEDKILMGADSREMMKLHERKGATNMEKRMDFLNIWNMA